MLDDSRESGRLPALRHHFLLFHIDVPTRPGAVRTGQAPNEKYQRDPRHTMNSTESYMEGPPTDISRGGLDSSEAIKQYAVDSWSRWGMTQVTQSEKKAKWSIFGCTVFLSLGDSHKVHSLAVLYCIVGF